MTGTFYYGSEVTWSVTDFLSFDICHGLGEPCDYFEVSFLYSSDMLPMLSKVNRFRAEHGGEVVFNGIVDEYTISIDDTGATVTVSGRSFAALLMDNEAEAVVYGAVTLDTVLGNHVTPYGIGPAKKKNMLPLYMFTVESGDSQWSVLKRYCRFSSGIQPRFSKDGTLILNDQAGKTVDLTRYGATLKTKYTDTRYGNISEVLVKNRVTGASYTVQNAEFKKRGGCARRVINVPRTSTYDSMRYTGQYQISESAKDKRRGSVTVPLLFAAFPADKVKMANSAAGLCGTYKVSSSHCFANENGYGTVLELEV